MIRALSSLPWAIRLNADTLPCGQVTRSRFQSIVQWDRSYPCPVRSYQFDTVRTGPSSETPCDCLSC
jgi:hypothetical protein